VTVPRAACCQLAQAGCLQCEGAAPLAGSLAARRASGQSALTAPHLAAAGCGCCCCCCCLDLDNWRVGGLGVEIALALHAPGGSMNGAAGCMQQRRCRQLLSFSSLGLEGGSGSAKVFGPCWFGHWHAYHAGMARCGAVGKLLGAPVDTVVSLGCGDSWC
jgi:hypothetical protein